MQALFLACIRAHEADYWRIVFQVPGYVPRQEMYLFIWP